MVISHGETGADGVRYRFRPMQRDLTIAPYPAIERLAHWCAVLDREGMTPEEDGASTGNLSFRTPSGFVITASNTAFKRGLSTDDFVEVLRVDLRGANEGIIHYHGGGQRGLVPSSDTLVHHAIYAARTDVNAVLHGHDPYILAAGESLGAPITTRVVEHGTPLDAELTVQALAGADYCVRRDHGFIATGRDLDRAGAVALAFARLARR